jgi:hypothetical protein
MRRTFLLTHGLRFELQVLSVLGLRWVILDAAICCKHSSVLRLLWTLLNSIIMSCPWQAFLTRACVLAVRHFLTIRVSPRLYRVYPKWRVPDSSNAVKTCFLTIYLFSEMHKRVQIRSISAVKPGSFFSADDGDVPDVQTDGRLQAVHRSTKTLYLRSDTEYWRCLLACCLK